MFGTTIRDVTGTPAGAGGDVQFNTGGAFDAEAAFTYDKATNTLTVGTVSAAASVTATTFVTAGTYLKTTATVVGSLVAAATAGAGALAFVTDANATTARSTVAAGGANKVLVMSDGTNWLIVA